jgi:hypothetical protein
MHGDKINQCKTVVGEPQGKTTLRRSKSDLEFNVKKRICNKILVRIQTEFVLIGQGYIGVSCEYGNEPSGSVKGEDFLH